MRVAITGANAGIGLRAAIAFASRGHRVTAFSRDPGRAEAAFALLPPERRRLVEVVQLDLASRSSIHAAAATVSAGGALDALINNAATFDLTARHAELTVHGNERFWATNHLGPTELTARLSPVLAASDSPRVVFVGSKGILTMPWLKIRFDALDGAGWFTPTRAYYHSKLAQVMTAMRLAERAGNAIDVTCIRVPAVRLDADRLAAQPPVLRALYAPKNRMALEPDALAATYLRAVLDPPRHARGAEVYVDESLRVVPLPPAARREEVRERLWQVTDDLIGNPAWAWPALAG